MSRKDRRAAAAKARSKKTHQSRETTLGRALDFLRDAGPTVSGITVILPTGETMFLDKSVSGAMTGTAPAKGSA